jgi:hypothetical protein
VSDACAGTAGLLEGMLLLAVGSKSQTKTRVRRAHADEMSQPTRVVSPSVREFEPLKNARYMECLQSLSIGRVFKPRPVLRYTPSPKLKRLI